MKIIKFLIIIPILILVTFFLDMMKVNYNFTNKPFIEFNTKNINSRFYKKIYSQLDKEYENFLLKFFLTHSSYWIPEDESTRKMLPEEYIVHSKGPFTENKILYEKNLENWPRSHGNNNSNRFSDLTIINKNNIQKLEIAWIYNSKDINESKFQFDVQCNPIIVNGKIYSPTVGGYIVSIDGYTGKELWRSEKFKDDVARRGIIYWEGNSSVKSRIYFSNSNQLVALNADDGKLVKSFGKKNGYIKTGLSKITPLIFNNYIILATWDKALEVYDLLNGKIIFKISFQDQKNARNGGKKYNNSKGGNPWGGISGDIDRGIVYVTTGNPYSYFDGTQRPGINKYSNSIIAIDIVNKKILWDFQEVSHDIWNSDLPAPPILTSVKRNNKLIDVVVVPTKRGNTLVLDRVTGESLFDLNYRKAPVSFLPGEKTSPYQLDLKTPEPFARNIFSYSDISKLNDESKLYIENIVKNSKYGFFETNELGKKTIRYNFHGGAEWMGGSVDHDKNVLYVTANNIPEITEIIKGHGKNTYISKFERLLDQNGYPGSTPPWGTLSALNLNTGKLIWSIPFGSYSELEKKGFPRTGTENFGGATATKADLIFATGTLDKMIYAFDSLEGKELWKKELPFIGSAPPSIYTANGEQFVLVQSTGSHSLRGAGEGGGYPNVIMGDALVAFKVKNELK